MNDKINLCEILKDCPKGTKLYSIIYGEVKFNGIEEGCTFPINFVTKEGNESTVTSDGKHYNCHDGDCTLFPSKDQRDWSKFTAPWLEKQGEPNPYSGVSFKYNGHTWCMCGRDNGVEILVDGEIKERIFLDNKPRGKSALEALKEEKVDNANKVGPEFKVGDWITFYGSNTFKILKIEEGINGVLNYLLLDQNGHYSYFNKTYVDKNARLWTIQDAKDGDVLSSSWLEDKNLYEKIIIFKKYHSDGVIGLYSTPCVEGYGNTFKNGEMKFNEKVPYYSKTWTCNLHPAIKEQRDAFVKAMKESGYYWDADKKELEKLVPNRFDPKTLKPFDKVIVRDDKYQAWFCTLFSHKGEDCGYPYDTASGAYFCCIPYNEDTKHLVGTKDDAPEYYRYWEDLV